MTNDRRFVGAQGAWCLSRRIQASRFCELAAASVLVSGLILAMSGCGSTAAAPDRRGVPETDRAWLLPPVEGYSGPLRTQDRLELARAYRVLVDENQKEVARTVATLILDNDAEIVPAQVLLSQVDFLERRYDLIVERLKPALADQPPGYRAGQLLLAYAAEEQSDLLTAFMAYEDVAATSPRASRNAERLRGQAIQIARLRFEEVLDRGEVEMAVAWLEKLERWRPGDPDNLALQGMLAAAQGDPASQLSLLRRLGQNPNSTPEVREQWAMLEVSHGEARTGLKIYEDLTQQYPNDAGLADRSAAATFSWQFQRLPTEVRELRDEPDLSRAEVATLLYWNVRRIRSAPGSVSELADDAISHPRQQAVVRVLSHGVMGLADPALRRFEPDGAASRQDLLAALLRVAKEFGGATCARDLPSSQPSAETVCALATRCEILVDGAECLAGAPVSGSEAVDLIRRGLLLLE